MLFVVVLATVVLTTHAFPHEPHAIWDGGYGAIELDTEYHQHCPRAYRSLCTGTVDPPARIAYVFTGEPRAERRLCLQTGGPRASGTAAVELYAAAARQSSKFDEGPGPTSDLVDFGPVRLRLPTTAMSEQTPLYAGQSPLCQGGLPLTPASPLWSLWPNMTLSASSLVLGGSPRYLSEHLRYASPILQCETDDPQHLCVTRGAVFNTTYRVAFDSGSTFMRVPPTLYEALMLARTFGPIHQTVDIALPPPDEAPAGNETALAACARQYEEILGLQGDRCGDGSGLFLLKIAMKDLEDKTHEGAHVSLLQPQSDEEAAASRALHGGLETIEISTSVWESLRMHVNHHHGVAVIKQHRNRQHVSFERLIVVLLMTLLLLRHEMTNTHLAWMKRPRISPGVVKTIVVEAAGIGLVIYCMHAPFASDIMRDAPGWFRPQFLAITWALLAVVAVSLITYVTRLYHIGLNRVVLVGVGRGGGSDAVAAYHRHERGHLVRSTAVETSLLWGIYVITLERHNDDFGTLGAVLVVLTIVFKLVMALLRFFAVEWDMPSRGSAWWACVAVLLEGLLLHAMFVGGALTLMPWLRRELRLGYGNTLGAAAVVFVVVASVAIYFNQHFMLRYFGETAALREAARAMPQQNRVQPTVDAALAMVRHRHRTAKR